MADRAAPLRALLARLREALAADHAGEEARRLSLLLEKLEALREGEG